MTNATRCLRPLLPALLLLAGARAAHALDGYGIAPPPPPPPEGSTSALAADASTSADASTYYEHALAERTLSATEALEAASGGGLPGALYVVEAAGGVEYRDRSDGLWQVRVEVGERPHERVDAVYDLVLALALPAGFRTSQWRIGVREGREGSSAAVVYAGEKVSLKRNAPLEASWLPRLVGATDGLPDLAGTGYAWTLWDTIVRYDASAGSTLQGFGTLDYAADGAVAAPDAADPRHAAYVITWLPTLDATVPPFTLRLDVIEPGEE